MTEQQTVAPPPKASTKPPAGMPVIVDVTARSKAGGGVGFTHDWRWENGTPGGSGSIDVPEREKHQPGTPIHFHFKDETVPRLGLDFTDDADHAMWVKRDSCPPDYPPCEDPQIPTANMQRSPNLLKVFDVNSEACTLHYRLRFKDRQGRPESYDPEIRNGGTTVSE